MKICVVGTGAAGWMAANYFAIDKNIEKVTIIGSPEIMPIGVGESNTIVLNDFHAEIGSSMEDFVFKSDAAVKYGVFYKNWSDEDFLHNFKRKGTPWNHIKIKSKSYFASLSNRDSETKFHDLYAKDLFDTVRSNNVILNFDEYPISWHFDAGKYIDYLANHIKTSNLEVIHSTVLGCVFEDKEIKSLKLQNGSQVEADYFIFATGSNSSISDQLGLEYVDLSDVLLTNKAYVYPLEYKEKRKQFHPYTVAKTMKCGWRWITPTYSRIGTGYVFSDRHISHEQALEEFLQDIGDPNITPRLVPFEPKYSKKTFNSNFCTIGMCNGFLEPLDAPGITLTLDALVRLKYLFNQQRRYGTGVVYEHCLWTSNKSIEHLYKFWAAFILAQYKTCYRNDTDFWKDHKNVQWDFYDDVLERFDSPDGNDISNADMIFHTMSARRYKWKYYSDIPPFALASELNDQTMNHLDYIEGFHQKARSTRG